MKCYLPQMWDHIAYPALGTTGKVGHFWRPFPECSANSRKLAQSWTKLGQVRQSVGICSLFFWGAEGAGRELQPA